MEVNYVCSCQAATEPRLFFKMRSATCKDFSLLYSQMNNQAARNNTPSRIQFRNASYCHQNLVEEQTYFSN